MTIRETYDFLLSIRKIEQNIVKKFAQCEALRSCLLPSGIRYDLDKIQTSPDDPMSNIESQIMDLEKEILELQRAKAQKIAEISLKLCRLPDDNEQIVLLGYYIACKPMETVASMVNYSVSHTYYLKRKAISHLSRLL